MGHPASDTPEPVDNRDKAVQAGRSRQEEVRAQAPKRRSRSA
jgi:hypothetical protein